MSRRTAALGSALFFAVAPSSVAGLVPWLLTGWDAHSLPLPLRIAGALLTLAGSAWLIQAYVRLVVEGLGTPAPIAPPQRLVVGGVFRWVRNPIYIALTAAIAGQALLLGRVELLAYAAVVWATTAAFVRWYEEPNLERRFGADYAEYRRTVPAWLPRPPRG